jgi:signal transduction histidine kinase
MATAESDLRHDTPITTRTLHRERVKVSQNVAASIAQELRNPIFAITSAAQLLRYRVTDDPLVDKNIGRVLREAERLNDLVAALLDYGRPAPVRLEPADPDEVWTDVIETQRGTLESRAILVQYTPARPRVTCGIDAEQLAQAFTNTLVNAIEASKEGSDLTIVSSTSTDGSWQSRLHNDGDPLPAETLTRMFEPLYTTKRRHVGTGLAVAHRVLNDHGGTIALENDPGGGVTVTFTLPAARVL